MSNFSNLISRATEGLSTQKSSNKHFGLEHFIKASTDQMLMTRGGYGGFCRIHYTDNCPMFSCTGSRVGSGVPSSSKGLGSNFQSGGNSIWDSAAAKAIGSAASWALGKLSGFGSSVFKHSYLNNYPERNQRYWDSISGAPMDGWKTFDSIRTGKIKLPK